MSTHFSIARSSSLVGILVASFLDGWTQQRDPSVVAMVADAKIRLEDLQAEIARRGNASAVDPKTVLQQMINRRALVARARRLGLERNPEIVRAYENLLITH